MDAALIQARQSSSSERIFAAGGAAAMAAGAGLVWYFDPASSASFFPACPLYSVTGFACPGCGLTRGFHALFHGDVLTALDHNALIPLVIAFFGFVFYSLVSVAVRGRGFAVSSWSLTLIWVVFVTLLGFGVLRNLPWYPFTVLFP